MSSPIDTAGAARAWVAKLGSGEVSPEDIAEFEIWLDQDDHRQAFAKVRAVWQGVRQAPSFQLPTQSVLHIAKARNRRPFYIAATTALAACLMVALFGKGFLGSAFADYATATGEFSRVQLPDGSLAVLDTNSAIDVRYSKGERHIVLLQGRAWFQVRHRVNRPFDVAALGATVRDIGTAFSVALVNGTAELSVTQGRVELDANATKLSLTQGQQTHWTINSEPSQIKSFDPQVATAWLNRRIIFSETPLKAAIAEIAKYHPGEILLFAGNNSQTPVNGDFFTNRTDDALTVLARSQSLQVVHVTPWLTILVRQG